MNKTCTACLSIKPLSCFAMQAATKDGLKYMCRVCDAAKGKVYAAANAERRAARDKAYTLSNIAAKKSYGKAYHLANRDKSHARIAAYRALHKETINMKVRQARLLNKDKINSQTRARRLTNPAQAYTSESTRRAKKLSATPSWANLAAIKDFYITAAALGMHTGDHYHVDHIIPLQGRLVCGLHVENNLQILTASENSSKGNRYTI